MATLSEAEVHLWAEYRELHGFPADRVAVGVAKAGAYTGGCFGGKASVGELLAKFRAAQNGTARANLDSVKAWFTTRAVKPAASEG